MNKMEFARSLIYQDQTDDLGPDQVRNILCTGVTYILEYRLYGMARELLEEVTNQETWLRRYFLFVALLLDPALLPEILKRWQDLQCDGHLDGQWLARTIEEIFPEFVENQWEDDAMGKTLKQIQENPPYKISSHENWMSCSCGVDLMGYGYPPSVQEVAEKWKRVCRK